MRNIQEQGYKLLKPKTIVKWTSTRHGDLYGRVSQVVLDPNRKPGIGRVSYEISVQKKVGDKWVTDGRFAMLTIPATKLQVVEQRFTRPNNPVLAVDEYSRGPATFQRLMQEAIGPRDNFSPEKMKSLEAQMYGPPKPKQPIENLSQEKSDLLTKMMLGLK